MTRRPRILLVTTTALLLMSACGGSEESSDSGATDASTAEQIEDLVDSGAADEIAEATGLSEACIQLSLAVSAATAGMVPGDSGQSLDIETLTKSFDAIKGEAPEDLRDDIDTVKDGMSSYLTMLAEYGNDFTVLMTDPEAMERFAAIFDDQTFSEASERFSAWMDSVCSQ